jgi:hypothetical protein
MAYRNKTYIAFDGDEDMDYYRLMTAWKAHDGFSLEFNNAHDLNTARDSSLAENIKRQLRVRFANSKLFIVLIGEKTRFLTKFVQWEMEVALSLGLPIIAVNLNGSRLKDNLCPPAISNALVIFVPFKHDIIEYAMDHWPDEHKRHKTAGKTGAFYYTDAVYTKLGL